MTGDYFFYIAAAYAICFAVLAAMTVSTLICWRKVRKELDE